MVLFKQTERIDRDFLAFFAILLTSWHFSVSGKNPALLAIGQKPAACFGGFNLKIHQTKKLSANFKYIMKTGYLIDMDGVIYRENQMIPGAIDFIEALLTTSTPFLFLTNNSAPTPEDLAVRLKHLGVSGLSPRHFYTSAMNTADFLSETDPDCTVFVIGEGGLLTALH
jgi:hypothetical protein